MSNPHKKRAAKNKTPLLRINRKQATFCKGQEPALLHKRRVVA
jgi:hypothetical protein